MNTNKNENNMKEMNFSELEQANGGILPLLLGAGTAASGAAILALRPDKEKRDKLFNK